MEVTAFGGNSVRLTTKSIAVAVDPSPNVSSKLSNDVVLLTQSHDSASAGEAMVIDGPGEYEVKGAMITGLPARLHVDEQKDGQRGTVYGLTADGIKVAVVGNIHPDLTDSQVELLGQPHLLIIPVGGHGLTLDGQAAAKIVSQLEPKYVVPVHFDDGVTKYDVPQDKVEVFLKEVGASPEPQSKLKLTLKDLPVETITALLKA